jgi:hypothetical protein
VPSRSEVNEGCRAEARRAKAGHCIRELRPGKPAPRKEPWGQTVTRLLGPEGLLVGITHTPSMRK